LSDCAICAEGNWPHGQSAPEHEAVPYLLACVSCLKPADNNPHACHYCDGPLCEMCAADGCHDQLHWCDADRMNRAAYNAWADRKNSQAFTLSLSA
jgi:hypothetical protein